MKMGKIVKNTENAVFHEKGCFLAFSMKIVVTIDDYRATAFVKNQNFIESESQKSLTYPTKKFSTTAVLFTSGNRCYN